MPERFSGLGILGEVVEQGGPTAPVPVPFSEKALGIWADDLEIAVARVRQDVDLWVEVLEVRHCMPRWQVTCCAMLLNTAMLVHPTLISRCLLA